MKNKKTAEHHGRKKKRVWPKRIAALLLTVILVFAAATFGIMYAFDIFGTGLNDSGTVSPDTLDTPEKNDDTNKTERLNFLLIGTDGSNSRTDTLILASFDFVEKKISLVSIPRDTRILIGDKYHKINACSVFGGDKLLFETLRDITGAPIHYYAKVSFSGFRNIVDILGGVDFDVPVNMNYSDPYQNLHINLKKGPQHLNGAEAEQLVRFRKYSEADIQRTRVQKDFIKALIDQKLTPEYILKAPSLYSEIMEHVTTNFTANDLMKNLEIIKLFQNVGVDAITTYELPGTAKMINSTSYWIHDVDDTLELFEEHFGGSGESGMYDKYIAAEKSALAHVEPEKPQKPSITDSDTTDEGVIADDIKDADTSDKDGDKSDKDDDKSSDGKDNDKTDSDKKDNDKQDTDKKDDSKSDSDKKDDGKKDDKTDTTKPSDSTKPDDTSKPSTDTSKPDTDTSKPSTDTSKPSEDTSKPSEDTSKPSTDTSKPSTDTSKPSEDTSADTTPTTPPKEEVDVTKPPAWLTRS